MDGGLIKKYPIATINIIAFIIVMVINVFDQISRSQSLAGRAIYTLPFLILIALCYIFRNKYKFNAYLYFGMSLLALMTTSEAGNLTGLIFLIYSLYVFQSFKTNMIVVIITSIGIASKIFFGFTAMEIAGTYLGYVYCLLIYYILIHPKKPTVVPAHDLDQDNRKIVEYLVAGYNNKEIAYRVALTENAVTKRLKAMRDHFEVRTNSQLSYELSLKGFFKHD